MSTSNIFDHQTNAVWSWEDSTKGAWTSAKHSYSTPRAHFFIMEVTPKEMLSEAYRGYVALDNIQLKEGETRRGIWEIKYSRFQ